jgi:hypothetical protein
MNTHRTRIHRNIFTISVALGTLIATGAAANDQTQPAGVATARVVVKKVKIGRGMRPDDSFTLKLAVRGAAKRLEKVDACSALFDGLRIDGLQALARSRYETPQSQWEQRQCASGIAAYTVVGSNRVVVCRHFQRLDRRVQSAVLIHEALHTAGLSEAPLDPDAMTAVEIESMVEEACGLGR